MVQGLSVDALEGHLKSGWQWQRPRSQPCHHLCLIPSGRGIPLQGKVRDVYEVGDQLVIVTTDRQSAFDRVLAAIPYKVPPTPLPSCIRT